MIDGIKRQLHQQVQTAFDQIARLTEAKQQLIRVNFLHRLRITFHSSLSIDRIYKINIRLLPFAKKIYN